MAEKQGPESDGESAGESRRNFIKKLPYIAPAIETFLLSETAYAQAGRGRGRGRGRGEVSTTPTKKDKKDKKDKK